MVGDCPGSFYHLAKECCRMNMDRRYSNINNIRDP